MNAFTEVELAYLRGEGLLARVATIGKDGTPHIAPVGMWSVNPELDAIDVTGFNFDQTKKYRDVARTGRAAIVVDDMVKLDPSERQPGGWDSRPRGIEIRGRAEAITDPQPMIRIYPERIISWGLGGAGRPGSRYARDVAQRPESRGRFSDEAGVATMVVTRASPAPRGFPDGEGALSKEGRS